jgi:hypothetical protein
LSRILVHTCCGPCLIYPYERLERRGFEVFSFFYNPNIHPYEEYRRRLKAWKDFVNEFQIPHENSPYSPEFYFQAVSFRERERCLHCYRLRLEASVKKAREMDFDYFSTTLLVSPYQKHNEARGIGESLGELYGVPFFYEDFREGYYQGARKSRELSMYRQWYCGCLYSEIERMEEKERKRRGRKKQDESGIVS